MSVSTPPLKRLADGGGLFCDGDWIEAPYITDEGIRLIQTGNVGVGEYREQGFRYVSDETFRELNCTEVRPGDVLICRLADPVGRSCIAPRLGSKMITAVDVAILRVAPAVADPRFVNYYCSSTPYLDLVDSIARGGTRQRISREQLGAVPIPLPQLHEQRVVANFLDVETARIDSLIKKKRQMINILEERRVVVTTSVVTNPKWRRVKLTLVARLGSGHTPSRDRPDWWENATIPWITTGDVHRMRGDRIEFIAETKFAISDLGLANSAAELHPAETVVLSRTASVGFSAIMARPMATSQDFATWTCGPHLRPRFLLLCLRAMRGELLGRLAMGSTHKTIYMPDIEAIRVPLPPVEEQDRLVTEVWERLRPIDATVAAIERQIGLLRERRQALITAAVTGQLDVAKAAA